MNIAVLHPQCRVRGGAIKMALLSAQSLRKQGHRVIFYTFDHDPECFPELQDGLTIVTMKTRRKEHTAQAVQTIQDTVQSEGIVASGKAKPNLDTVDRPRSFFGIFHTVFPRFSSILSIAWDIRQVDIAIAHNPPMHIVAALAKMLSLFSSYHQRLVVIWWHHHIPWYYVPRKIQNTKDKIHPHSHTFSSESFSRFFTVKIWKGFFERHYILPQVKYLIATSYYTAYCIEKYCGRKAIVMHPVIMTNEQGTMNNAGEKVMNNDGKARPITLFTHGRLEPGKGLDTLVKAWKELQVQQQNAGIKLIIAGEGSLKNWLIEQGATVISYQESLLEDIKKTENDIIAIYLSTIDAFGMAPLEAQIAGLPVIILDKGGARETVLLDNNHEPMAQLIDSENEIIPAITYFIQQRSLQKRMSNVNFCHQREYFTVSRLDAEIRSLIDSIR